MARQHDLGKAGEERAVEYLIRQGYLILERNWRLQHKEVDIICTDGQLIVIVEVKTRSAGEENPGELLDYKKRRNLLRAGAAYLAQKEIRKELRFDLVIVSGEHCDIQHIREAIQTFDS